jgi:hypothetical protein
MDKELICLKRKINHKPLSSGLHPLIAEKILCDVTLVSDDKTPFQAHKVLISAFSPVLKNLLHENPHPHPLIYLIGVDRRELQLFLQFLYLGEAKIYKDRIQSFRDIARELHFTELTDILELQSKVSNNEHEHTHEEEYKNDARRSISSTVDELLSLDIPQFSTGTNKLKPARKLHKCDSCKSVFKTKKSFLYHSRTEHKIVKLKYACTHCDYKTNKKKSMYRHEVNHEDVEYSCNKCEYKAKSTRSLSRHTQIVHEGQKYLCDQCEFQASEKGSVQRHKQSKHSNVRYYCEQCDYQASRQDGIKNHKQMKHSNETNTTYKRKSNSCDKCEYQTIWKNHLKRHQESVHEGKTYSCDNCEVKTKEKGSLIRHKRNFHTSIIYFCDQCNFQAKRQDTLKVHKRSKHDVVK